MVDCFWYPLDAFWILGMAWELFGHPVWDEALKDGQQELEMEALSLTGADLGHSGAHLGSLWLPLGQFGVTLDDFLAKLWIS